MTHSFGEGLMMDTLEESLPIPEAAPSTVAHGVLDTFFTELEGTDGFDAVAKRLRKVVLTDGSFAETAIRQALFDEDAAP